MNYGDNNKSTGKSNRNDKYEEEEALEREERKKREDDVFEKIMKK